MPSLEIIEDDAEMPPSVSSTPQQPSKSAPAKVSTKKKEKKTDEKEMKHSSSAATSDKSTKRSRQMTLGSFFAAGAATTSNATSHKISNQKRPKEAETENASSALASQRRKQLRDIVVGVFPKSSPSLTNRKDDVEKDDEGGDDATSAGTANGKVAAVSLPTVSAAVSSTDAVQPEEHKGETSIVAAAPVATLQPRKRPSLPKKAKPSAPRISLSPLPTSMSASSLNGSSKMKLEDRKKNDRPRKRISVSPAEPPRQKRIRWSDSAATVASSDRVDPEPPPDVAMDVTTAHATVSDSGDHVDDAMVLVPEENTAIERRAPELMNAELADVKDSTPLATGVSVARDPRVSFPEKLENPASKEADATATAAELDRIRSWRTTYQQRVRELIQACHQGLPEEQGSLQLELLPPLTTSAESTTTFPDSAILSLASIIEGQSLPLVELAAMAARVLNELNASHSNNIHQQNDSTLIFDEPMVLAKIELLATRKHFVKTVGPPTDKLLDNETSSLLNDARMYRWEVLVPSAESYAAFFPNASNRTIVKKARTSRKKISAYLTALLKALTVLQEAEQLIMSLANENEDSKKKKQQQQKDKALTRVETEVEKLVKFEREQEAHRLAEVARLEKLEADRRQKEQALLQKQAAAAARQKEKETKQQQLAESREAAQKIKDAAQKAKEATRAVEPKEKAKPAVNMKQKQCMMSFLAKATSNSPVEQTTTPPKTQSSDAMDLELADPLLHRDTLPPLPRVVLFDVDAFRSAIAGPNEPLSSRAPWSSIRSRHHQRRTPMVKVPVFVTIYPEGYQQDNPFAAQPYAEQVRVSVRNKYKFLSFYEDVRPPYFGTWSKTSRCISGRHPFRTDKEQLEYDLDSEGEWEEGDDEVGEELGDDGMDEEEKEFEDEDDDDEEDGWLAADDEVDSDDDDEENDELDDGIKKPHVKKVGMASKRDALSVGIVAPLIGQPLSRLGLESGNSHCLFEGMNANDALSFLESFCTICLDNTPISLRAFPPALVDEVDPSCETPVERLQVMTEESMKIFASFVHQCALGSKDKLIDEFLVAHTNVSSNRALALRTLDSIAEKKKHPCNGTFFWEVKKSVLENLGLTELAESTAIEVEDLKQEAMKTIVRFVHNNRTASKEKIVDDLRACHESVTASRAEALRILQSIAVKEKHPNGGYIWIVNDDVRCALTVSLESSNRTNSRGPV
jgi:Chromatin assembly factor 1 subunit A